MKRAHGLFTIKSFDDDARTFTGIASTPTPDRMGDVVEPKGAQFTLPISLLHQHKHDRPVGAITRAKVTDDGIDVAGYVEKSAGLSPTLVDRLDTAWQELKLGLVRGLSIGFKPVEESFNKETMGFHFLKWDWLELSLVTIPANADATIQTIKQFDSEARAALGQTRHRIVKLAGVSAPVIKRKTETDMTLEEQLKAMEARRAASTARMEALMTASAEKGETLGEDEAEEYDGLEADVGSIDKHLTRLRKSVELQKTTARPVDNVTDIESGSRARSGVPQVTVRSNLEPGIEFARYAMCLACVKGDKGAAIELAKARYPDQPRIQNVLRAQMATGYDLTMVQRAAIAGGSTTHITWAGPLVQVDTGFIGDFVEYLRPRTILGRFGNGGIPSLNRVPFNVSVPGQTTGGTGYWVGEGAAKPVTKFDFNRTTVPFTKVANIAVITQELARFSTPSAETVVRNELAKALIQRLDTDFVDPAKALVAGVSPASVTNGTTPIVASGYTQAALQKDLAALVLKFTSAGLSLSSGVWIMGTQVALNMGLMLNALGQATYPAMSIQGGMLLGMPVIVSDAVATVLQGSPTIARPIIVLVAADEIWLADDGGVSIDVSQEASLQMDSAPTNTPTGLGASPNAPTATTLVSMFQTDSIAIRAEREIAWLKRRAAAAAYISNASYSA